MTEPSRTAQLTSSTLIVMIAFTAAKAISFLQTFIIARSFGISAEYDAFVAANRLPEVIFNLIAGGAVAFAFIPVFAGLLAKDDRSTAWRTASTVLNTIFGLTAVVSILAFILSPWLVQNAIAPGFPPEVQQQTADMMRILLLSTLIFSISGTVMGILQSFNRFLLPALAPILFDVGILIGVIFLLPVLGIYGLAWGAVLGAAMHLAIQVPGLLRVGIRWSASLDWRAPEFRRILILFVPRMLDLALVSVSSIVVTNLLSRLGEGATSAYDWGWRLMQIPETLIGTAMGIVIFPTLASLSALGDVSGKRAAFSGSLRFILIATIPSAVLLIAAGLPILSLLEGGAFDASATQLVYSALVWFSFGIVVHSILEVVARSFYADKDTLVPLLVAVGGAAVNIIVALVFSGVLTGDVRPENVGALALANTLGVLFEVIALGIVLRKRWHGLDETHIGRVMVKAIAASIVMGAVAFGVNLVLETVGLTGGVVVTVIRVGLIVAAALVTFIGASYLLRIEEVKIFLSQSVSKIRDTITRKPAQAAA
ncbi:MAG: murein biosynthesis integral membrane protein MurJ [Pleurocapsa minor GSE-CHR-MK-17-07R]|jgi:putative peptidoglycan lipid II flippase|nr:murein biosynthesis integral membrane protein MurJ [Pleurocapsa minor GSE-CHR-MK 17-07R]